MKRARFWLFVAAILVLAGLAGGTVAQASSYMSGYTELDWTTFNVSWTAGITNFAWTSKSDMSNGLAYFGATQKPVPAEDQNEQTLNAWGNTHARKDAVNGSNVARGEAWTDPNFLRAEYYGNLETGGESHENGTAGRYGTFSVTGSGSVTFTVNYDMQWQVLLDGATDWAAPFNIAGLKVKNFNAGTESPADWPAGAFIGNWDMNPLHDPVGFHGPADYRALNSNPLNPPVNKLTGTLSVTLNFDDGQQGVFGAGMGGSRFYDWMPTAAPVPIPGALLLLGPALAGIAVIKRKLGKCQARDRLDM